jgi:hypothetical protein
LGFRRLIVGSDFPPVPAVQGPGLTDLDAIQERILEMSVDTIEDAGPPPLAACGVGVPDAPASID